MDFRMNAVFGNHEQRLKYAVAKIWEQVRPITIPPSDPSAISIPQENDPVVIGIDDVPAAWHFKKEAEDKKVIQKGEPLGLSYNGLSIFIDDENITVRKISPFIMTTEYSDVYCNYSVVLPNGIASHKYGYSVKTLVDIWDAESVVYIDRGSTESLDFPNATFLSHPSHVPCLYYCPDTSNAYRVVIDGGQLLCSPILLDGKGTASLTRAEKDNVSLLKEPNLSKLLQSHSYFIDKSIVSAFNNLTGQNVSEKELDIYDLRGLMEKVTATLRDVLNRNCKEIILEAANSLIRRMQMEPFTDYEKAIEWLLIIDKGSEQLGAIKPMFLNDDLLKIANITACMYSSPLNPCTVYGGPNLRFPVEAKSVFVNRALFGAFQRALFRENLGLPLRFVCEKSWN